MKWGIVVFPEKVEELKGLASGSGIEVHVIGQVGGAEIIFNNAGQEIINIPVKDAADIWENVIENYMR